MLRSTGLALALATAGNLTAGDILSDGPWKTEHFTHAKGGVFETRSGDDCLSARLTATGKPGEKHIISFYKDLLFTDKNSSLSLSFDAKGEPGTSLIICAGKAPGSVPPGTRHTVEMKNDFQRFDFEAPLQILDSGKNIFEFIWEGKMSPGAELNVRDIRVRPNGKTGIVTLKPVSSTRFADDQNTDICIRIYAPQTLDGCRVKATISDNGGKIIRAGELVFKYPETDWNINPGKLEPGCYLIKAELPGSDPNRKTEISRAYHIIQSSEQGGCVRDGRAYYKGKPFLPLGIYHAAPWNIENINARNKMIGSPQITLDKAYGNIRASGFNLLLGDLKEHDDEIKTFVSTADRHGLLIAPTISVKSAADKFPNLFGLYGSDEPSPGAGVATVKYNSLKEKNPPAPVLTANFPDHALDFISKEGCYANIYMYDGYPIKNHESDLSSVSAALKKYYSVIKQYPDMMLGLVPQTFTFLGKEPAPEQIRAEVYIGVVNSARAFVFYAYNENYSGEPFSSTCENPKDMQTGMSKNPRRQHWWLEDSLIWDSLPELLAELRALEDFILFDGKKLDVTCDSKAVDFAAKEINGRKYLIAVNMTGGKCAAKFNFPGGAALTGVFDKSINIKTDGSAELPFKEYEVKILCVN